MNDEPVFPIRDYDQHVETEAYHVLVATLRAALPPLPGLAPEKLAVRERAAIAAAAALVPANVYEANLAARSVAAGAFHDAWMIEAGRCANNPIKAEQARRWAVSMGRESRGFLSALMRAQTIRRRRESSPAAMDQAARTQHAVLGMMRLSLEMQNPVAAVQQAAPTAAVQPHQSDSLATLQAGAAPQPALPERQEPAAQPLPTPSRSAPPAARPRPAPTRASEQFPGLSGQSTRAPAPPTLGSEPPHSDLAAAAERYAMVYPRRARAIRQHGGLPPNADFGRPEDGLLQALLSSTHPAVTALDLPATG
ncbi:MAG TPA: hypothetical protein VMB34_32840 [Acetobacteraceae bacterium]|nr:hypothetical protein [Acetobacteraceae bacterium]